MTKPEDDYLNFFLEDHGITSAEIDALLGPAASIEELLLLDYPVLKAYVSVQQMSHYINNDSLFNSCDEDFINIFKLLSVFCQHDGILFLMDISRQLEPSLLTLGLDLLVDVCSVQIINQRMHAQINQLSTHNQPRGYMIIRGIFLLITGKFPIEVADFQ